MDRPPSSTVQALATDLGELVAAGFDPGFEQKLSAALDLVDARLGKRRTTTEERMLALRQLVEEVAQEVAIDLDNAASNPRLPARDSLELQNRALVIRGLFQLGAQWKGQSPTRRREVLGDMIGLSESGVRKGLERKTYKHLAEVLTQRVEGTSLQDDPESLLADLEDLRGRWNSLEQNIVFAEVYDDDYHPPDADRFPEMEDVQGALSYSLWLFGELMIEQEKRGAVRKRQATRHGSRFVEAVDLAKGIASGYPTWDRGEPRTDARLRRLLARSADVREFQDLVQFEPAGRALLEHWQGWVICTCEDGIVCEIDRRREMATRLGRLLWDLSGRRTDHPGIPPDGPWDPEDWTGP